MPSSRESSQAMDQTNVSYVSCIDRQVFYHQHHLRNTTIYSLLFWSPNIPIIIIEPNSVVASPMVNPVL